MRTWYGGIFDETIIWARKIIVKDLDCLEPFEVVTVKKISGAFSDYGRWIMPNGALTGGTIRVERGLRIDVATEFLLHEIAHHVDECITGPSRIKHRGSWGRYLAYLRNKGWD